VPSVSVAVAASEIVAGAVKVEPDDGLVNVTVGGLLVVFGLPAVTPVKVAVEARPVLWLVTARPT
jgi:hypothetical protein